ncbi:MAG: Alanine racemase (EC [uncultured Sulfurovum sp.]|uniref:Alanine racemase (EC) n=1 Tax=uncultured Sulfurovum sp. TaxID=269237 RepID=A0A6S6SRB0_9BACT|nr:MAG: Alanine racemase (EC [uncultured Sulfurovum sp.]
MAFIKINKENFFHNLSQFVQKTGSKESIGIVLKDNAYGHGLELMAKLSQEFGLTQAVVRSYAEAKIIKPYFKHILVLGDQAIFDEQCSFTLNSLEDISKAQKGSMVELKVDTGMHRNGISFDELEEALELIKEKKLIFKGVMTHNRSADELSSELFWQQKKFKKVVGVTMSHSNVDSKSIRFHSFNSASALRLPCDNQDFIRLGIGAYGYSELPSVYESLNLKPVLSLHANRISTKTLKKGQRIGYGGTYIAPHNMTVSTYDLGYGDGWMRSSSLKPFITAENLPLLGRVSMDYIIVESSENEICIFNNAQNVAEQFQTIPYEITTLLKETTKRIIGL